MNSSTHPVHQTVALALIGVLAFTRSAAVHAAPDPDVSFTHTHSKAVVTDRKTPGLVGDYYVFIKNTGKVDLVCEIDAVGKYDAHAGRSDSGPDSMRTFTQSNRGDVPVGKSVRFRFWHDGLVQVDSYTPTCRKL